MPKTSNPKMHTLRPPTQQQRLNLRLPTTTRCAHSRVAALCGLGGAGCAYWLFHPPRGGLSDGKSEPSSSQAPRHPAGQRLGEVLVSNLFSRDETKTTKGRSVGQTHARGFKHFLTYLQINTSANFVAPFLTERQRESKRYLGTKFLLSQSLRRHPFTFHPERLQSECTCSLPAGDEEKYQ